MKPLRSAFSRLNLDALTRDTSSGIYSKSLIAIYNDYSSRLDSRAGRQYKVDVGSLTHKRKLECLWKLFICYGFGRRYGRARRTLLLIWLFLVRGVKVLRFHRLFKRLFRGYCFFFSLHNLFWRFLNFILWVRLFLLEEFYRCFNWLSLFNRLSA